MHAMICKVWSELCCNGMLALMQHFAAALHCEIGMNKANLQWQLQYYNP